MYQKSELHIKNINRAAAMAAEKSRALKQLRAKAYNEDPSRCRHCLRALDYSKRTNKFCSTRCAVTATNLGRGPRGEGTKSRISDGLKLYYQGQPAPLRSSCRHCGKPVKKAEHLYCGRECANACPVNRGKVGLGVKASIEAGVHPGWKQRKRGVGSYPEQYFTTVFNSVGLTSFCRELKVGRWFVDFAFEGSLVAVEIDGRQHLQPERAQKDIEKDQFLEMLGWKVIRVSWATPNTTKGRILLATQIGCLVQALKESRLH